MAYRRSFSRLRAVDAMVKMKKTTVGGPYRGGKNMQTERNKRFLAAPANPVKDARLKIMSKKRTRVSDARDLLAKMAKGTDARQKLTKIRNMKAGKVRRP